VQVNNSATTGNAIAAKLLLTTFLPGWFTTFLPG
jgi:hypothetical protein